MVKHHVEKFSHHVARWAGTSIAFIVVISLLFIWLVTGFFVSYSNGWAVAFGIFLSITSFILLFIMQRANTKDLMAIHLKLNGLIASQHTASNELINIEEATEEDIKHMHELHRKLSQGV